MSINIIPLAFLICAVAIGFSVVCLIGQERYFTRNAKRTTAIVTAISPLGNGGQLVPFVEFYDEDNRLVQKRAQRYGARGVKEGDEVQILYTRKKVFGLDAWNIFIMKNPESRPYRLYTVFGVIFGVIAMGFAIAGVVLWLR